MLELLAFVLAAVTVIVVLQLVANRTGLPVAVLLTLAGLLYAILPGPNLTLDPHIILTFMIPPLIYSAALNSSLTAIRENLRTVISLSIGLVIATAMVTGVGMRIFVPEAGLAAGIALGAAIAPTDPVAALAVGGGVRLPSRLITLIEGEGLLNDATALTMLTVAARSSLRTCTCSGSSPHARKVSSSFPGGITQGCQSAESFEFLGLPPKETQNFPACPCREYAGCHDISGK
jgi:monovalent cation/hydrogen antiporter